MRILNFELGGVMMKVICLDGSPCESFDTNRITLGPAQRVDVLIEDASELVELLEVSSSKALNAAILNQFSQAYKR